MDTLETYPADQNNQVDNVILLTDQNTISDDQFLGEFIGMAIVDSGCNKSCAGETWINLYLESLSVAERKSVYTTPECAKFRFGNGPVYISSQKIFVPVHIGKTKAILGVFKLPCDTPLLSSFPENRYKPPMQF